MGGRGVFGIVVVVVVVVVGGDKDLMIDGIGESKESVFPGLVQSAEDVVDREIEGANDGGGVVEGREWMEFGEGGERFFRVGWGVTGCVGIVVVGIDDGVVVGWTVGIADATGVFIVLPLVLIVGIGNESLNVIILVVVRVVVHRMIMIIPSAAGRRRKRRRRGRRRRIRRRLLLRPLLLVGRPRAIPPLRRGSRTFSRPTIPRCHHFLRLSFLLFLLLF